MEGRRKEPSRDPTLMGLMAPEPGPPSCACPLLCLSEGVGSGVPAAKLAFFAFAFPFPLLPSPLATLEHRLDPLFCRPTPCLDGSVLNPLEWDPHQRLHPRHLPMPLQDHC